jgi:hypothetical protein
MDIFVLAGQSNMAGRGNVVRGADGKNFFQRDALQEESFKGGELEASRLRRARLTRLLRISMRRLITLRKPQPSVHGRSFNS